MLFWYFGNGFLTFFFLLIYFSSNIKTTLFQSYDDDSHSVLQTLSNQWAINKDVKKKTILFFVSFLFNLFFVCLKEKIKQTKKKLRISCRNSSSGSNSYYSSLFFQPKTLLKDSIFFFGCFFLFSFFIYFLLSYSVFLSNFPRQKINKINK